MADPYAEFGGKATDPYAEFGGKATAAPPPQAGAAPAPAQAPTGTPQTQGGIAPYIQEGVAGIGRGLHGLGSFVQSLAPQNVWEKALGPAAIAGRQLVDLDKSLRNAYEASSASRASGEGAAGQTLSFMENAPLIGGAVRKAEEAGPGYAKFAPQTLGAVTEGATLAAAPKVAEETLGRAGKVADIYRTKQILNKEVAKAEPVDTAGLDEKFVHQARTLNTIDKGAQAVHSAAKSHIQLLKGKLVSDAQASIEPLLEADRTAGQKPIVPAQAVAEAAKAMNDTGYVPTPKEQAILDTLGESPEDFVAKKLGYSNADTAKADVGAVVFNDFVKRSGLEQGAGLTLDKALQIRTALGKAAARATDPKAGLVLTRTYQGMNDAINGRMNELQGITRTDPTGRPVSNPAFEQYNKNHKAAFELDDGFTGKLLEDTLDHHEARQSLKDFAGANLTQIAKQMRDKGMASNANQLYQLQRDAQSTLSAHDAVMGKFTKSVIQRMFKGDAQSLLPLSIYALSKKAGFYGIVPYALAAIEGRFSSEQAAMVDFAKVLKRLDVPDKVLNTRTQPGPFQSQTIPPPAAPPTVPPTETPSGPTPTTPTQGEPPIETEMRLGTANPPEPAKLKGVGSKLGTPEEIQRIQAAMEGRGAKKQAMESGEKAAEVQRIRRRMH